MRVLVEHYGYDRRLTRMPYSARGHKSPHKTSWFGVCGRQKRQAGTHACAGGRVQDRQHRDPFRSMTTTRAYRVVHPRPSGCEFFVATKCPPHLGVPAAARLARLGAINEIPKATDWGNAKRLQEIKESLRAFNRKEFQDLLFVCHSILRDVHKMDPGRAFDTIRKSCSSRCTSSAWGCTGTFTLEYLDKRAASRMPNDPQVHDGLFELTKDFYKADELFNRQRQAGHFEATFRRIVMELERFDLATVRRRHQGAGLRAFPRHDLPGRAGSVLHAASGGRVHGGPAGPCRR